MGTPPRRGPGATIERTSDTPHPWLVPTGDAQGFLRDLDAGLQSAWSPWREVVPEDADREDHGVVAALRLAQLAVHLGGADHTGTSGDRVALREALAVPLHAIARHNLHDQRVKVSKEPLACLLRLCDEVQEWGRFRIDSEKLVLGSYLDLIDMPGAGREALKTSDSLHHAATNLRFRRPGAGLRIEAGSAGGLEAGLALLRFTLRYRDDLDASYEPVLVLLSKAWNLQHIDLALEQRDGIRDLRWCLELEFPFFTARVVPVWLDGALRHGADLPYGLGALQGCVRAEAPDRLSATVREIRRPRAIVELLRRLFTQRDALDAWLRAVEPSDAFVPPPARLRVDTDVEKAWGRAE